MTMTGKRGDGRHGAAGDPRTPTHPAAAGHQGHETAPVAAPTCQHSDQEIRQSFVLLRAETARLVLSDLTGRDLEAACRVLSRLAYPHKGSDLAHDLHATVLLNRVREARREEAAARQDREPPEAA